MELKVSLALHNDKENSLVLLASSLVEIDPTEDVDVLTETYTKTLASTLDQLAPTVSKTIVHKTRAKWFSLDLLKERQLLRSYERKWLKSNLTIDLQVFTDAKSNYKRHVQDLKSEYLRSRINGAKNVFVVIDEISGDKSLTANVLPDGANPDKFAEYFTTKIDKIRDSFIDLEPAVTESKIAQSKFVCFESLSTCRVKKIIGGMKNKSCGLDPIIYISFISCT